MQIQYSVIFAYIIGILLLYFLGKQFLIPVKYVLKLIYNALIGGIVLVIINFIGSAFQFQIALNIITALIVGILGIPGVLLIIILQRIL